MISLLRGLANPGRALKRAGLTMGLVLMAHLLVIWAMLKYQAEQILSAGLSDAVVNIQFASVSPPAESNSDPPTSRPAESTKKVLPTAKRISPPASKDLPSTNDPGNLASRSKPEVQGNDGRETASKSEVEANVGGSTSSIDSQEPTILSQTSATNGPQAETAPQRELVTSEVKPNSPLPTVSSVDKPVAETPVSDKPSSLGKLYSQPLAAFPSPTRLSFAVHSPKDFDESSATGVAELRSEAFVDQAGLQSFQVELEVKLGWLLSKMIGGSLRYQSQGRIGQNGPQTMRYQEKIGDRPERWLEVDREKRVMKSFQIASLGLEPGTQDRLSVMWLLSMLARTDPAVLEKGKTFSVPMFSFRQIYPARFESYGAEVLVSPAGVLQTLHVGYKSQEAGGDKVDVWLGYDFEMQPVRIRWQETQGRVIDMILQKKPVQSGATQ
jgi:Protein of unknown function (DUF3108)